MIRADNWPRRRGVRFGMRPSRRSMQVVVREALPALSTLAIVEDALVSQPLASFDSTFALLDEPLPEVIQ